MRRRCLDCGAVSSGSRCPRHDRARHSLAYGAAYQRERARLIGEPCSIKGPGCTGTATTADHIVPVAAGGAGGPLRPACAHCNYARQAGGGRVG